MSQQIKNGEITEYSHCRSAIMINALIVVIILIWGLLPHNEYFAMNISDHNNYLKRNSFNVAISECLTKASNTTANLQSHTVNGAFIIDGNLQQIYKYFTLIQLHIDEWYNKVTKIYLITDASQNDLLKTIPTIFELFPNNTFITNLTKLNKFVSGTNEQKMQYIERNIIREEDILIWLTTNETNCIYNIGSDEWIKHKTMHTTNWNDYRLADMVKLKLFRILNNGYAYHKQHFPNSIAVQYMNEINESIKGGDLNLLLQIISNRKQLYPSKDTLVIHLRTGDVLDDKCEWKPVIKGNKIHKEMTKFMYDPISLLKQLKPQFEKNNISNVVILTGFHKENINHENSANYIIKIRNWFEENNFSVYFRINEDPDQDFMLMCNSRFFIESPGGYSFLIARIVQRRNGTVFNFANTYFVPMLPNEKRECLENM